MKYTLDNKFPRLTAASQWTSSSSNGTGLHGENGGQLCFCSLLVKGPKPECCTQQDKYQQIHLVSRLLFAFAVRTHLFPDVKPSRLPVVAYTGNISMPEAEFEASLGPHMGETCSTEVCMRLRELRRLSVGVA